EILGSRAPEMRLQIFGTDLSDVMIDHARAGTYSSAIAKDVSRARLRRFFVERDSVYQINRRVRDICTFARQNVITDPPFSRLDLISCRNVLIYLSPELHKRCIPQFHHALNPGGYLILGPAESVGMFDELFELVDKKNKIYTKKMVSTPRLARLPDDFGTTFVTSGMRTAFAAAAGSSAQLIQAADRIMLWTYPPAAVVIDHEMHVRQFRGRPDAYLKHHPGPATLNLLQLVRPSLVADLRNVIRRCIKTNKPVRKERSLIKYDGRTREINVQVVPFKVPNSEQSWLLVIFD